MFTLQLSQYRTHSLIKPHQSPLSRESVRGTCTRRIPTTQESRTFPNTPKPFSSASSTVGEERGNSSQRQLITLKLHRLDEYDDLACAQQRVRTTRRRNREASALAATPDDALRPRHEESCFPTIHPSIHGQLRRLNAALDGDAAAYRGSGLSRVLSDVVTALETSAVARLPRFISSGKALCLLCLFSSYARTRTHARRSVRGSYARLTYTPVNAPRRRPVSIGLQTNTRQR